MERQQHQKHRALELALIAMVAIAACGDNDELAPDAPLAAPDADASERDHCIEVIDGMLAAQDIDTALVPLPAGWTIAAGPWSRYNADLAIVTDVWRYRGVIGALTIFLHDGVVTCVYREQFVPPGGAR